ncbi:response regulator transcription factor [Clostridium felsineum]|uniref:response regulator transcription factor n=1 Tax=Clostridium felsineum TaxID=36839 RepID=UPI00214D7A31|nr:response regulator transcription factor [Clostridium felsineum]MCR3759020.1 response regulator transcription factor [Clostridium felsineum]
MDTLKILIVDDEIRIREMIKEYISLEDLEADEASDGLEALNLLKTNEYSLIILDIMMPKIDGLSVLKKIRKTSEIPIIMLTARGEEYDKLFGFELGADDYLVKPFSPKELLARIKVILKRSKKSVSDSEKITIQGITVDFTSRNVYVDGNLKNLTPKEYELLSFFIRNRNKVFSRQQLLNSVWGYDFIGDDRTVDTHIKMLRENLGDYRKFIITVWGTGYKFESGENQ